VKDNEERPKVGTWWDYVSDDGRPGHDLSQYNGPCEVRYILEDYVGKGAWAVTVRNSEGEAWVAWPRELHERDWSRW
jgi:hypothetical protein